jgi:hypothetical protein
MTGTAVLMLIGELDIRIITGSEGELLQELTRDYQPPGHLDGKYVARQVTTLSRDNTNGVGGGLELGFRPSSDHDHLRINGL